MLLVLVISIAVGWVRGGRLRNLIDMRVRLWWLLPLGFIALAASSLIPSDRSDLAVILVLASYLPLLLFVGLNRDMTGIWIAGMGILMNFTVIALNNGMPVLTEAVIIAGGASEFVFNARYVLLTEDTVIPFFADVIPLPGAVLSLGDVFLAIGIGALLEDQMRKPLILFSRKAAGVPGSAAE